MSRQKIDSQDREITAFRQMHPKLAARFAGKYAAIFKAELVDHDADLAILFKC